MRAKPPKCKSLSFKVFKKGKSIPFLGDEPFKFLCRKMSSKKNGLTRAEIKENYIGNLEITSKANITGHMKVWLYNNFIVAFITWPFMIYDLPISFGEELKAVAPKYLKKWLGITKSITESGLYRSKDHFGLGLIDLVTHLKKMQVCRMHMLEYSQDGSSNNLNEYKRERDKPPVNGVGIPMKSKLWRPTIALETAERSFYLDNIAFNHHRQVLGKSHVKWIGTIP